MATANDSNDIQGNSPKTQHAVVDIAFTLPTRLFQHEDDDRHGPSNSSKLILKCIDCHAGGEPARVVLSGFPRLPASSGEDQDGCSTTMTTTTTTSALQKRNYIMANLDHVRKILLLEPRGYPCQNANYIFLPPTPASSSASTESDEDGPHDHHHRHIQYVIAEQNKIYPLMSGHNTICVATALLECGVVGPMVEPVTQFTLEAPAGLIEITATCCAGKAQSIAFRNAPSFVEHLDIVVDVPHGDIGPVKLDVAYGGMWYAIVDIKQFQKNQDEPNKLNLQLDPACGKELCRVGEMIKVACREQYPVQHPTTDYPGCDILVFRDTTAGNKNRNAVIMSNNVLD